MPLKIEVSWSKSAPHFSSFSSCAYSFCGKVIGDGQSRESKTSARVAFHYPGFVRFQLARFCIVTSTEMQSVAVGWQVYEITRRPLDLGLAGLAQFLPGILLFLVAGHAADRFERRKLIVLCYSGFALCSALLLFLSLRGIHTVYPIYIVLVFLGVVRSLTGPVSRALLPQLVPEEYFPSAIAWASSVFQFATILGPSLGGVAYAAFRGPSAVYALGLVAATFAVFSTLRIKTQSSQRRASRSLARRSSPDYGTSGTKR